VGGDGTVNEIGRSLIDTGTALGIIPCGSGNGLARHLHIPMDVQKALRIVYDGKVDLIDYGKINDVPFFCTCGVGFDALVSQKFAEAGKRGLLTYLEKTLQESLRYHPQTYELQTDTETERYKAFVIACGNASQYGNNAYIAPQAELTDGLLDVTILEPFNVLDVPSLAFQLFNKTIDHNSHIKTFRCRALTMHREEAGAAHFDGDPVMLGKEIDVKIFRKGLHVIVPQPPSTDASPKVLERAQGYINGLRQMNGTVLDEWTQKNKALLQKGKEQIRKLTKIE
jgi:YegS/Rv2252/BmrU family lipid kinase